MCCAPFVVMPILETTNTADRGDELRGELTGQQLPAMSSLARSVLAASSEEERERCFTALYKSTEQELNNVRQIIDQDLASIECSPKKMAPGVSVVLPHYVEINRKENAQEGGPASAVFMNPSSFDLLRCLKSDVNKGVNGAMQFSFSALSKGEFLQRKIQLHQTGKIDLSAISNLVDVATLLASISENPSNPYRQVNPRSISNISKIILQGCYDEETIFKVAVLAWCAFIGRTSSIPNNTRSSSSLITREQLEQCTAAPNAAAASRSSFAMQREYSDRFPNDQPSTQFERLVRSAAFEDFISMVRNGCPLHIPGVGQGLIKPLCWGEKCKSQASKDDYLSAQVVWVSPQPNGIDAMFLARMHSLHRRDFPLKCPSMRVLRILPDMISDQYLEPRQYLIDKSRDGVNEAIRALALERAVVGDASGNRWISFKLLDDVATAHHATKEKREAVQTLLAATHFSHYTKRMVE